MTTPVTPLSLDDKKTLEKDLRAILLECRAASVTQNIAEKFLVPFALFLQASAFAVGILSTLPQLLGALTQLFSVKVLHTFPDRKKVIVKFIFYQSLLWLPLFFIPLLFPSFGVFALIVSYCIYYMLGGFFNPAWISWLVYIVPEHARGKFFGRKNQTAGRFGFLAATLGGYMLSVFADINLWVAYGILFLAAFAAKLLSFLYILRIHESEEIKKIPSFQGVTFQDFLRHILETSFGQYVLYMCLMSFAVNLAAPFFTPYMLHTVVEGGLGFSYLQFTILTAVAASGGFLVFRHWGFISDRFGNKRVLVVTGFLIPFIPLFWLFSSNFYYLLIVEIFSGIVWAGFNLTTTNYVFDLVGSKNRMIYNAYYNVMTTIAVFLGALVGSCLHVVSLWFGIHDITFLFSISFIFRFAIALFFFTKLKELRDVEGYHFFYELALRPMQGFSHGAVQYMRDSFIHFKRKHIVDILKVERYIEKELDGKDENKTENIAKRTNKRKV